MRYFIYIQYALIVYDRTPDPKQNNITTITAMNAFA
jgi:hypothetical protein